MSSENNLNDNTKVVESASFSMSMPNVNNQDVTMSSTEDHQFDPQNHSLKISRHFISLLEEYRYLLSCLMDTCGCHANFDYQFFLKKLENRYDKLSNLVASNQQISKILYDENDEAENTLEQLMEQIGQQQHPNQMDSQKFITRVRICERPKSATMMMRLTPMMRHQDPDDQEMIHIDDDGEGVYEEGGIDQEATEQFFELPKFDLSMKDAKIAYKCSYPKCDFLSFNQDDLIEHLKTHGGTANDHASVKTGDLEKRDILYVCEQCGKEFAGQKWLDNHVDNVHTYTRMFQCDYPGCSYHSKFRCVMEDHKRRHAKQKEFKCIWEDCDSEFVTKRDMIAHVNFYHKGIKNYFCNWPNCEASFKDSNRLKHHYYTHTGERPYKCDFPGCDASFKQAPHLHKHKRIHSVSYSSNNNRNQQQQQSRTSLHQTRSSTMLIACPEEDCGKKFRSEDDLDRHQKQNHQINIKIEDEVYRCLMDDCELYFTTKDDLSEHLSDKHSIEFNNIKLEAV